MKRGKRRKLRLSPSLKKRLDTVVRQNRRDTVYRMTAKHNGGIVPCFVCGRHVPLKYATAEHILPRSLGGTDDVSNLAISHERCNNLRGNSAGTGIAEQRSYIGTKRGQVTWTRAYDRH